MKNLRGLFHSAIKIWFSLVLIWSFGCNIKAQTSEGTGFREVLADFDKAYGVDPKLVNGVKYVNFYSAAIGNPWLVEPRFGYGWLQIDGKKFNGQKLNFDVYNERVVAEYNSPLIGTQLFIIPDVHLEGFQLDGRIFRKIAAANREAGIYEIVSGGKYMLLHSYKKTYTLSRNVNDRNYRFSNIIVNRYLFFDDNLLKFTSKRSFRKLFPPQIQNEIRTYMKDHKISFRRSGIQEIKSLMKYINSIV